MSSGETAGASPDLNGEPAFELERPDRFVALVKSRRRARELRSPRSLLVLSASFLVAATGASVMLDGSAGIAAAAGVFGMLLVGRPIVSERAERRATSHAHERLRDALQECWRRERKNVDEWGSRHGLAAISDTGFTAPLDTTPILLEGDEADYANVLRGPLGDGTATFFHLTQLGGFPGRAGEDAGAAFRWLTCIHMKRRRRDLVMTVHPRRPDVPSCGLNRVPLHEIDDAWRSPDVDGTEQVDSTEHNLNAVSRFSHMVDAGWIPRRAVELMSECEHADDDRRRVLVEELRQEALAWRQRDGGGKRGFAAMLDMVRAMRDTGWREVKLESVTFNERYCLRTKDLDDIEIVGIFDPAVIVEMTESVPADVFVEMHFDNLLVAMPGRVLDVALLDALLETTERLGRHVDEAPVISS